MGDPREKYYGGPERVVMGDVRVTFGEPKFINLGDF